jgi:uncharacterized circularly permuted ATP-grasp superfamily protein
MSGKFWDNYNATKAYDGYFTNENKLRKHAVIISNILERYGKEKLQEIEKNCQSTISARGINFRVYAANNRAEEKKWPLDIIPRIIPKSQWNKVTKGLKQRVKALNLFIDDVYNQKKIFKDNIIPREIIFNSPYYVKECEGFSPKYKSWANVFPELFTRYKVASIHQYTNKLFNCMNECIPKKTAHPHMVVLTPGIYNSAYFEHSFLAEQMGIALVEGKDLFVENDNVYMKTVKGPLKVDCIYRRLDDNFLDPKVFNKNSVIGVPGLFKCWLKKNVGIINAIGTGVADDKVVYSYVNRMIVYYLGEQPILNQVETYLCHDESQKKYVLENLSKLVVKPANASGGYGIMIGPKASSKEREEVAEKIKKNPREYIAQPLETLSTAPTITEKNIEPRHLDLRPFVLSGKTSYVTTGGLTRVALRKGSTIVNSSQGGGSKDTLIVE